MYKCMYRYAIAVVMQIHLPATSGFARFPCLKIRYLYLLYVDMISKHMLECRITLLASNVQANPFMSSTFKTN